MYTHTVHAHTHTSHAHTDPSTETEREIHTDSLTDVHNHIQTHTQACTQSQEPLFMIPRMRTDRQIICKRYPLICE